MTSTSTYSDPTRPAPPENLNEVQLNIQTGQPELRDLPAGTTPALDNATWHGTQKPGGPLTLIYHQAALEQIQAHGLNSPNVEVGGVLLGHVYRQQAQVIVEIHRALPAHTADHGPYHFTFTADAWSRIHQDRAIQYPELDILGWFHTHPNLGVFYSADDVVVHTAAFSLAWHIGLVIDPQNNEVAHFGWVNEEIAPLPGFFELIPAGETSIIPWRSVRTAVWHDTYEAHLAAQGAREQQRINIGGVSIPADAIPLIGGALVVLAAFLLMVGMLFISNQRVNRLEAIAHDLFIANLVAVDDPSLAACDLETVRLLDPYPGENIEQTGIVPIYGTANEPGVPRYQLQVTNEATGELVVIREFSRGLANNSRILGRWDTTGLPAGTYVLSLVGLNRDQTFYQDGNVHCSLVITLER